MTRQTVTGAGVTLNTNNSTVYRLKYAYGQVNFDDWVLYSTTSPVAADSRGLGAGHFFDGAGQVIATVVQEGVVKYFPAPGR